jgi:hypothetical protein
MRWKSGVRIVMPCERALSRNENNASAFASLSAAASIFSQSSRDASFTPKARSACTRFSSRPA